MALFGMRTWLLPLAGFIGVALLALMLSASNLDNRAEIQIVALVACAVIGADAIRRGLVQLRISAHAVAALCLGVGIFAFVIFSEIPITLIPFELAEKVTIGEAELDRLSRGDAAARWLSAVSRPWAKYWRTSLGRAGFYPFDFLAVSYLTTPSAFGCDVAPARVGFSAFLQPIGAGRDLEVASRIRGPLVRYCTAVDRARLSLTPAPSESPRGPAPRVRSRSPVRE